MTKEKLDGTPELNWQTNPSRENWRKLGDFLATVERTEKGAEAAIDWALGLWRPRDEASFEKERITRDLVVNAGHSSARGIIDFARELFFSARTMGVWRARDRAIRSLLCDSKDEEAPSFFAALAIARLFPKIGRRQGWPRRIDRSLEKVIESGDPKDSEDFPAGLIPNPVPAGNLVRPTHFELDAHWTVDEDFVPCAACQESKGPKLCAACVKARRKIQARNRENKKILEAGPLGGIAKTFAEKVTELLAKTEPAAWKLLQDAAWKFRREGASIPKPESHRTLSGPGPRATRWGK